MPEPTDSTSPEPSAPGPSSSNLANDNWARPTLRSVLLQPQLNAVTLLILAVALVPVFALLAHLTDPLLTWQQYVMMGIGTGWSGPLVVLVMLSLTKLILAVREKALYRRMLHSSSLLISVVASRAVYYEKAGVPNPAKAAALDAATLATLKADPVNGGHWVAEALEWYAANAADALPAPPARVQDLHNRFTARTARSRGDSTGNTP